MTLSGSLQATADIPPKFSRRRVFPHLHQAVKIASVKQKFSQFSPIRQWDPNPRKDACRLEVPHRPW